jgi:hypothetical protein
MIEDDEKPDPLHKRVWEFFMNIWTWPLPYKPEHKQEDDPGVPP